MNLRSFLYCSSSNSMLELSSFCFWSLSWRSLAILVAPLPVSSTKFVVLSLLLLMCSLKAGSFTLGVGSLNDSLTLPSKVNP